ncbi:MAG: VWA domain-containing protein [Paracoccaceae bacterium]
MPKFAARIILTLSLVFTSFGALYAQEGAGKTILVLDASGSMWGQIDGEAKITIAQRVIGNLLESLPDKQELGLTAYGHRVKGDCSDIETLVLPAQNTRDEILTAVNAISPKGKTPLSAAVEAAAEILRYEEDKATVILVSDGRETCDMDPCAIGAELEYFGVDFTAHVVGFDVSNDPEAAAQLQCLAENTGGRYLTASNADELSQALEEVAAPVLPSEFDITIAAHLNTHSGRLIVEDLVWTLTNIDDAEILLDHASQGQIDMTLSTGSYLVEVLRTSDEASNELAFEVGPDGGRYFTLTLPEIVEKATLEAPDTALLGATIEVVWSGPNEPNDYVFVSEIGAKNGAYINLSRTRNGNPLALVMPPEVGEYELRYIQYADTQVLATRPITILPLDVSLSAAQTAIAGADVQVDWDGPNYQNDYISVAEIGTTGAKYVNFIRTRDHNSAALQMPTKAGQYEIRYILYQDKSILARQVIDVSPVSASLTAADTAAAGEQFKVSWIGPDYKNDYISISEIGTPGAKYVNFTRTRQGQELKLTMPVKAGEYELRYVMYQDHTILARQTILVADITASIIAPDTADMGQDLVVEWGGPDYKNDYISVAEVGSDGGKYVNYTYTREGKSLRLQMPPTAGEYEIRYVQNQDNTVLARHLITVQEVGASITIDAEVSAGDDVIVNWNGPDYQNDYISVAEVGTAGGKYINYTYTRDGTPLRLEMPVEPGEYEVRYVQNQDNTVLARQLITVSAVSGQIMAPERALAGENVIVEWQGPDYQNDYISVAKIGSDDNKYEEYTYTRDGSPMRLQMPGTPGEYEIRYVINQDASVLVRRTITLDPVSATLDVPDSAALGSAVVVNWVGPDYRNDYIALSAVGAPDTEYETYVYTRDGSPLLLKLQDIPAGTYELRYVMSQDKKVLARAVIEVTE